MRINDDRYVQRTPLSLKNFQAALKVVPAGAGSTERTRFRGWQPYPPFITSGAGARVWDADGNEYLDYMLGLGPMVLGHRHPAVTAAVIDAVSRYGTCFAMPHELEVAAAAQVVAAVPGIDLVRFANSGSEAIGAAVRLARAYTERTLVVRFEGHYHGTQDVVQFTDPVNPGDDTSAPVSIPARTGIPAELAATLVILQWNDAAGFHRLMAERGDQIAAVLAEPVMFNAGCILPEPGYLELLRAETTRHGALLIFDEVVTGFRVGPGGAQQLYGVLPDLTTLAKALGGGFPVAALGGSRQVMDLISTGRHAHSGTYNGNLIQCAAVCATLDVLGQQAAFTAPVARVRRLAEGLVQLAGQSGLPATATQLGLAFSFSFSDRPVRDWRTARDAADPQLYAWWHHEMLLRGVLFHPNVFENLFVSTAHDEAVIEQTLSAAAGAFAAVAERRSQAKP